MKQILSITGQITSIGEVQGGVTPNGNAWQRRCIKIKIHDDGNYSNPVWFHLSKKWIELPAYFKVNDHVQVWFTITAGGMGYPLLNINKIQLGEAPFQEIKHMKLQDPSDSATNTLR